MDILSKAEIKKWIEQNSALTGGLSMESMLLSQICLHLAALREENAEYRKLAIEHIDQQNARRQAALDLIKHLPFAAEGFTLTAPIVPFPTGSPESDGIPRDADGKPIPLD